MRQLAERALEAARLAGASYADVRLIHSKIESISTKNATLGALESRDDEGCGIRVLKDSIRRRAAQGAAVIISSHLLAMVEDICTHVLILNGGKSRFFGTLDELKETFVTSEHEATLEQIFFLATESRPLPQPAQTPVEVSC